MAQRALRLLTAASAGSGLGVTPSRKAPPYTPAVTRSLAIAAMAALGAAGDERLV